MDSISTGFEKKCFEYKPQKIKITGNIKRTIDFFDELRIAYERLFHMFCWINEFNYDRQSMFSDIWYSRKRGSGIPVVNGVSIDETLYEMHVWKLREISASTIIKALFYKKNDAAFECGFIKQELSDYCDSSVAVFNPSPFFIEYTLDNNYLYYVADDYFVSAYSNTFEKEKFYSYEESEQTDTLIGTISNEYDLNSFLKLSEVGAHNILMSISCSLYKKERTKILSQFDSQGLSIYKLLFVDSDIFETYPKRRVVIYASQTEKMQKIPVYNMRLQDDKMIIEDDSLVILYDYLETGRFSYKDIRILSSDSSAIISRNKPQIYFFSDEIIIRYRFVNRNGNVSAIASYNSYPDENGKSRRLIKETEKGLRFKNEGELPSRLDGVAFDEKNYSVIANDIKKAFMGKLYDLSIKSLWYINRNELLKMNEYNDDLCKNIFSHSYSFGSVKCESIFEGTFLDSIEQLLNDYDTVEKKESVVKQLHKLFNLLVNKDIVSFNPFSDILKNLNNKMEEEQYEVRNALTKKNLSINEQLKMLQRNSADGNWQYSYELKTVAVSFRLFTAVPVREMIALNWGDIQYNKEYGFSRVCITRAIDRNGNLIEYGTGGDWIKRRQIPLVPELARLLILRKKKIMREFNISEDILNDMPLFCENYGANKCKRMKYDAFNDIFRKAILSVEIPELFVKLPGSKEFETDLNKYYSDIFISNFRHIANHLCSLKTGEISYILGVSANDTKDIYYIDYDNDSIQYEVYKKLCRWSYLLHDKDIDGIDEYNKRFSDSYNYSFVSDKTGKLNIEISNELGADIQLIVENDND